MKSKVCTKCSIRKPIEKFARNRSKGSGYNSWCKLCQKPYKDRHYRRNKKAYYLRRDARILEMREWLTSLKAGKPCTDCSKVFPPVCMDFDHIGQDKSFSIGNAIKNWGKQTILEEIDKCELVCANCHRIRTWKRQQ